MDFNDPKEFDDILVSHDPKGISIGSMDFDYPKVFGTTSIFAISDGLYNKNWNPAQVSWV